MVTNNPVADFARHDAEQENWLARRPICAFCKEHIQDDGAYETDEGLCCEDCLEDKIYLWKSNNYKVIEED